MTFWEILLLLYGIANMLGCIFLPLSCLSTAEDEFWDILIFPKLIRWLRESLNIIGTIIVTVLFTICFLPALIIDFAIYLIILIAILIGGIFVALFSRKD